MKHTILITWEENEQGVLQKATLSADPETHPTDVKIMLEQFKEVVHKEFQNQINYLCDLYTDKQVEKLVESITMKELSAEWESRKGAIVKVINHEHHELPEKFEKTFGIL